MIIYLVSDESSDEGGGVLSGSSGSNINALDKHKDANSTVAAGVATGIAADDSALNMK